MSPKIRRYVTTSGRTSLSKPVGKNRPKAQRYLFTVRILSRFGSKPRTGSACGDTLFLWLDAGMSATYSMRRAPARKSKGTP